MHIPLTILPVLFSPVLLSSAFPLKRQAVSPEQAQVLAIQFAQVVDTLQETFYTQALQKFQPSDFTNAGFASANLPLEQLTTFLSDEKEHNTTWVELITALGAQPFPGCVFDLSSVLTSVSTTLSAVRFFENVAVGTFLGGAQFIQDGSILTESAAILTVDARHQTVSNILNGASAIPQAFDVPLLFQESLSLLGPFISGCLDGFPSTAPLTITNTGPIKPGTSLTFSSPAISSGADTSALSCQFLTGDMDEAIVSPFSGCVVPNDINGPVYVWITNSTDKLPNDVVSRVTGSIVAGPALTFLDTLPDVLGKLTRTGLSRS